MSWILYCLFFLICLGFGVLVKRRQSSRSQHNHVIAFFHPFSESGGGGERVLWMMIRCIQDQYPHLKMLLYTGQLSTMTCTYFITMAKNQFNIELKDSNIQICPLKFRGSIKPSNHPFMTMLSQNLASLLLGIQVLFFPSPKIILDTTGLPFCYPLFKALGIRVVAYVHYPTISSDMYANVVFNGGWRSKVKLKYFFEKMMEYSSTNSSWTNNHIVKAWGKDNKMIIYPPVDVTGLLKIPLSNKRQKWIISVSQFRPEKNHALQLRAFHQFVYKHCSTATGYKLILIGGCRNSEDEQRVRALKKICLELDIQDKVEFVINATYETLFGYFAAGQIGLHTMKEEHFGISIVEFMAAGMIPIAHNSGGPKEDIIDASSGFLCTTLEEYAEAISTVVSFDEQARMDMAVAARKRAMDKFSNENFKQRFLFFIKDCFL